jgi:hypothetical protein
MIYNFANFNRIYVDVDGCLLFWPGKRGRVPRPGEPGHGQPPEINKALADALREWKKQPARQYVVWGVKQKQVSDTAKTLVVWTAGGAQHAKDAANLCDIADIVDAFLPKPDCFVDDSCRWIETRTKVEVK